MKFIAKILILFLSISLLASCKSWNTQVDITAEDKQAIQDEIQQLKDEIKNFVPPEEGVIAYRQFIALSQAYEKLGDLDSAIKVYKDVLDDGHKTKAIINNLGRLYEKVGEYDLAIEQYQRLVDEYLDRNYLYDITWAYIRSGNRKEAEKVFNAWQLEFRKTDEQIQQAIKKMREEEKAEEK